MKRNGIDHSCIARIGPATAARGTHGGRLPAWLALGVLGISMGLGTTAFAQPRRDDPPPPAERRDARPAGSAERREQIKKKIRAMRAYTLTEALALDEPTAGRLFPLLARYDDETDKLLQKRVDVQRRLRHADSLKDPRAIEQLIDEAVANRRGFVDLEDRRIADLRKILTPAQTAKLLVVLPALERKIENQLRRAIVQRRPADSPPASAGDLDEDHELDEAEPPPPPRGPLRRRELPPAPRTPPSNAPGNTPQCSPNTEPCR